VLRCEVHGVEVPPTSFLGMISEATCAATFRTGAPRIDVPQADFDSTILEPKVDRLNQRGVVGPEQPGVVGDKCFHSPNLSHRRSRIRQHVPRKSPKNQVGKVTWLTLHDELEVRVLARWTVALRFFDPAAVLKLQLVGGDLRP
jgi:hypothetical protein